MELQTVQRILRERSLSFQMTLTCLLGQMETPQFQIKTCRKLTQEQQVQRRPLRRFVSVSVPQSDINGKKTMSFFALITEAGDPVNYKETIKSDDSDNWAIAIEQEMKSLERNQI